MAANPPKVLIKLVQWFCRPDLFPIIEGDLHEYYHQQFTKYGKHKANLLLCKEVLLLLRRSIIRPLASRNQWNHFDLFKSYVKVTFRHLVKHPKYSIINIAGLIIGVSSSFILLKHIEYFTSANQEQINKGFIHVVSQKQIKDLNESPWRRRTFFGLAPFAKSNYPHVSKASRYITTIESRVLYEAPDGKVIKHNERKIAEADPDLLQMFSFDFIHGNPRHALDNPNTVIITESTALKYFGNELPLGKILTTTAPWGSEYLLTVTGVVKDLPSNSSINFDFLKSLYQKTTEKEPDWSVPGYRTYLFIDDPLHSQALEASLGKDLTDLDVLKGTGSYRIKLEPLTSVNLTNTQQLILLVGILILIISWTNFANLLTAKSLSRAREIAMRKVNGSSTLHLFYHFATESIILHLIAFAGALGIIVGLFPFFQSIANDQLIPYYQNDYHVLGSFIFLVSLGALATAVYPVFVIRKYKPLTVIKNQIKPGAKNGFRIPVILQFVLSAVLIASAWVIKSQMTYLQDKKLGFNSDHIVIISPSKDGWDGKLARFQSFKSQIRDLAEVENVSSTASIPGRGMESFLAHLKEGDEEIEVTRMDVGPSFIEAMNLKLLSGDPFRKGGTFFRKNRRSVLVNESTAKNLGFRNTQDILGKKIKSNREAPFDFLEVIGVVEDFHFNSLRDAISPLMMTYNPFRGYIVARLHPSVYQNYESLKLTLRKMEGVWDNNYHHQVFDVRFLDDEFNYQFRQEITLRKLFTIFTAVSIFLSSLGLIGLSMFAALKRKSEVGIRKVMGASAIDIITLFSKEFMKQIILAIILSVPISYFLMTRWLENYSYRTDMTMWSFVIPNLILLFIGLIMVVGETWKSARSNPSEVLRDE